jgi:probable O-glycosylation ligase (exosortase A-associated)
MGLRDTVLIAAVLICSAIALRRPFFGMMTFVSLAFLNPHYAAWGMARVIPLSQITVAATLIGYFLSSERKKLPLQRESVLLICLWAIFGISTVFAIEPDRAFDKLFSVSKIMFTTFLCTAVVNSDYRIHTLLRVIALSLGFFALKGGFFAVVTGGKYMVWGPTGSFIHANNAIGLALAMNVPLLFYLRKTETNIWLKRLMTAMLVFSYPAVVCTFSRGAWIGLALATALLVVNSRYKYLLGLGVFGIGVILLPFLPQFLPDRVTSRYEDLANYKEEGSAQSRLMNWEFCKRVGLANPTLGGGFDFYSEQCYQKYFPEFLERYPGKTWSCHGIWHTVFAEHGFIGLFFFVGLVISCLSSLRRLRAYGTKSPELRWLDSYSLLLQVALLTFMAVGTFYDAAYFDMFYHLVAVIIILKERVKRPEPEDLSVTGLAENGAARS